MVVIRCWLCMRIYCVKSSVTLKYVFIFLINILFMKNNYIFNMFIVLAKQKSIHITIFKIC